MDTAVVGMEVTAEDMVVPVATLVVGEATEGTAAVGLEEQAAGDMVGTRAVVMVEPVVGTAPEL